ncbi:unnamed protein product, partial [Dicrocoelium dendriticum]
ARRRRKAFEVLGGFTAIGYDELGNNNEYDDDESFIFQKSADHSIPDSHSSDSDTPHENNDESLATNSSELRISKDGTSWTAIKNKRIKVVYFSAPCTVNLPFNTLKRRNL